LSLPRQPHCALGDTRIHGGPGWFLYVTLVQFKIVKALIILHATAAPYREDESLCPKQAAFAWKERPEEGKVREFGTGSTQRTAARNRCASIEIFIPPRQPLQAFALYSAYVFRCRRRSALHHRCCRWSFTLTKTHKSELQRVRGACFCASETAIEARRCTWCTNKSTCVGYEMWPTAQLQ
jgi:hypothetical protein